VDPVAGGDDRRGPLWHRRSVADAPLRIDTLVLRRELWSDAITAAPAGAPGLVAHGDDDDAIEEVRLFLTGALAIAQPTPVMRHLLPTSTALEIVAVDLIRADLPAKLRTPLRCAIAIIAVPDVVGDGAARGTWVFVPALNHTFHVARGVARATAVADEIRRVVAASALGLDGWLRLLPAAAIDLVPVSVELAQHGSAVANRRTLLEDERRRWAERTLDEVGGRWQPIAEPEPLPARLRESAALRALLAGRERLSVLILGDEGVGKTALVRAWADHGARRPLWVTSTAQLVAGASGLGQWQERLAQVLAAAELLDAALYLDDFGGLFAERPEEGGFHLAQVLRRWITGSRVRLIGELTSAALDRAERREVALLGAMTRLRLEPLEPAITIEVGRALVARWAQAQPQRPTIDPAVVPVVVELARRYLPYRAFPGKAVRFLDELRAVHDGERAADGGPRRLGIEETYEGFALVTGIPAFLLRDDRALLVDQVIARFRSRLIGQDEAVRRVAETICIVKARLQPADRPLATFLFVGPTGVGKTELAKSLAHLLFGAEDRLVRFDMSEYTDPWAAERLIRGHGQGDGLLTARVREQPFCVLLLDEIEKAHSSVFDLLLQVTGEGRLTDGRGRTTYFHNAIIILTSNLGTRGGKAALGLAAGDAADRDRAAELERYRSAVAGAFRPELVGRIDRVIAFHRLGQAEVAQVAHLALGRLGERRGLVQAGIALDVSPAATEALAVGGYSPALGVRALRRHLDAQVLAPAARLIAAAGRDAHGGLLVVRISDEPHGPPVGARLGADEAGGLVVALYRRSATSGARALRGALAVCALRRAADRDLLHPTVVEVREQITWLRSQLAAAVPPDRPHRRKKPALGAEQIQQMHVELARLTETWTVADAARVELRTAEELALEALAAGEDAEDIVATARATRADLRRAFFWLLVARLEPRDQITLLVNGPDGAAGVTAWTLAILGAADRLGWQLEGHLRGGAVPGARAWGPPIAAEWLRERLQSDGGGVKSLVLRVRGPGAFLLLRREAGVHRFFGIAKTSPCHAVVEAIAPRIALADEDWLHPALTASPPTQAPRGPADREHPERADHVLILGKARTVDVPRGAYGARLEEVAVEDLLGRQERAPDADAATLWGWAITDAAAATAEDDA
jgi:ATP-dependent Clp protease ATP-binding subunit ClpC